MMKLGVAAKVSDSSVWLLPLAYGETEYMKHSSASLRQFWLTHADAFHFEIEKRATKARSLQASGS